MAHRSSSTLFIPEGTTKPVAGTAEYHPHSGSASEQDIDAWGDSKVHYDQRQLDVDQLELQVEGEDILGSLIEASSAPSSGEDLFSEADEPEDEIRRIILEIGRPAAFDISRLAPESYAAQAARASTGGGRPLLLAYGVTPFAVPGTRPARLCEMAFETPILDPTEATLVGFAPESRVDDLAAAAARGSFELGAAGIAQIQAPPVAIPGLQALAGAPGVGVHARGAADGTVSGSIDISVKVQAIRIQAGPTSASGGVRWQLYKTDSTLSVMQSFVEVVTVPVECERLTIHVQASLRRKKVAFGRAPVWITPVKIFEVPIAALP